PDDNVRGLLVPGIRNSLERCGHVCVPDGSGAAVPGDDAVEMAAVRVARVERLQAVMREITRAERGGVVHLSVFDDVAPPNLVPHEVVVVRLETAALGVSDPDGGEKVRCPADGQVVHEE